MSYLCKNCGERFDMPIMLTSYPPKDGCPKCISTKIVRVGDTTQTRPNLDEVRARLDKATPGPWFNHSGFIHTEQNTIQNGIPAKSLIGTAYSNEADFISHAPTDIKSLLEYVAELEDRIEKALAERKEND